MTENQRALQVMGNPGREQRRSPRQLVHGGGVMFTGKDSHVAWIKDISEAGVCLYTNHRPELGDIVRIAVHAKNVPEKFKSQCEGKVIRIQSGGAGAAVGVAILFSMLGIVMGAA